MDAEARDQQVVMTVSVKLNSVAGFIGGGEKDCVMDAEARDQQVVMTVSVKLNL